MISVVTPKTWEAISLPIMSRLESLPDGSFTGIQDAVKRFVIEYSRHVKGNFDRSGFYHRTIEDVVNATSGHHLGDFYLVTLHSDVIGYALCGIIKNEDGKLAYNIRQAWINPKYRSWRLVKEFYPQLVERAKNLLCSSIIFSTARNAKALKRLVGNGTKIVSTILKEEI